MVWQLRLPRIGSAPNSLQNPRYMGGAGAYTWAFFDALLVDPACARVLDIPFFLEGMRDILERSEDPHKSNLFASFAAVLIPNAAKQYSEDLEAITALKQIQKSARWIMSDRLHELHPLIWGHAMEAFDNQARIASIDTIFKQGCEKANQVFVSLFGDQMLKGNALIFICNQGKSEISKACITSFCGSI